MTRIIAVAVLMFGLATPAWAGYDEGLAAYERGDYATALREYRKAAERGDYFSQYNLGYMYQEGQGVPQDYAEAVRWYRKSAEQGDVKGQSALGLMYERGQGVAQDYVRAYMWFNLAAALPQLGKDHDAAAEAREDVAKRMTRAQIAEAQRLAREWWANCLLCLVGEGGVVEGK